MARLVLINGAPGSGKSTLARMYAERHPMTLALDIDVVRGMLGGWLEQPRRAGLIARSIALEMARIQLEAGRDVLVPQFLGRVDFILELERLCRRAGAEFIELALLSSPEDAARRFARRSRHPETPEHRDAALLRERSGGMGQLPALYGQLLEVVASRPDTRTVTTVAGDIDRTYLDLLAHIDP